MLEFLLGDFVLGLSLCHYLGLFLELFIGYFFVFALGVLIKGVE